MPSILSLAQRVSISNTNGKMGPRVYSISFPPLPGICPRGALCRLDGCYACRMYARGDHPGIRRAWNRNLRLYWNDPHLFFSQVYAWAEHRQDGMNRGRMKRTLLRSGVGGDMPDFQYFEYLNNLPLFAPDIPILAFTKRIDILERAVETDLRIKLFFSAWPGMEIPEFVYDHNIPMAFLTEDPRVPTQAHLCPGHCEPCNYQCWRRDERHLALPRH